MLVAQNDTISLKDQQLFPKEAAFWKIQTNYYVSNDETTEIIVPSFGVMGALFSRHLEMLKQLKLKIA